MKNRSLTLLTLFWLLISCQLTLGQDWFSNDDTIKDLARFAPQDTGLFMGADLSELLTAERIKRYKGELASKGYAQKIVADMERALGYPLEEIGEVFGPRAVVSVSNAERGMPQMVLVFQAKDKVRAVDLFRKAGAIKADMKPKMMGTTKIYETRKSAYGFYQDYLVLSNSPSTLSSIFSEGQTLATRADFVHNAPIVMVDRGIFLFGAIPDGTDKFIDNFSHVLASLGLDRKNFVSQTLVLMREDSQLGKALVSKAGTLTGESARYVPDEWGFMLTFHLGYFQRVREHVRANEPELSREMEEGFADAEKMFGVTFEEILNVCTGEVSISSNGFSQAPRHFMGMARSAPYELTVSLPLKDSRGAETMLRKAWKRIGLNYKKGFDGVTTVEHIGLAYSVNRDSDILILSYGETAEKTLRRCLALRPGQSLAQRKLLTNDYPQTNSISSVYFNLEPVMQDMSEFADEIAPLRMLVSNENLAEGLMRLQPTTNGIKLTASGGTPMILAGIGSALWLMPSRSYDNEAHTEKPTSRPSDY